MTSPLGHFIDQSRVGGEEPNESRVGGEEQHICKSLS